MLKLPLSLLLVLFVMLFADNASSDDTTPDEAGDDAPEESQYRQGTPPGPLRPLDFSPFEDALTTLTDERIAELDAFVLEATVNLVRRALDNGTLTVAELVIYYIHRIRTYDVDGLRSIIELNPDALTIAQAMDDARANGETLGALHGIPVIIKDNIATGDNMHNTAGAVALRNSQSPRDAFLVSRLRDAGALILAKANMSEWAYWMFDNGPSGYTALGGQVVNAYGADVDPFGSSTGSAVGISANLAMLSVGTETAGSIIAPAARTSTVGMHPSIGLISRDLIIPLSDQLDTAGPITRTVADAALMLTIMMGVDTNDPMTRQTAPLTDADFTQNLQVDALTGRRVGIALPDTELSFEDALAEMHLTEVANTLRAAGVELVAVQISDDSGLEFDDFKTLLENGMRLGMIDYLNVTESGDIGSIADVVAFNNTDPDTYAFYGQEHLEASANSDATYDDMVALGTEMRRNARAFIHTIYASNDLDVLVTVDNFFSFFYAIAGYPAITVPGGFVGNRPFGVTFVGGEYLADATIIGYAYAYEVSSLLRLAPEMTND